MSYRVIIHEGDSDYDTERYSEPNKDELISLLAFIIRSDCGYELRVIYPGNDEWI